MKRWILIAWVCSVLQIGADPRAQGTIEPLSAFPRALLAIKTSAGNVHHFDIWIADREERQEQGLMFVQTLDPHRGMLFVYAKDREITMWMKNTFIPLDMVFIGGDHRISEIIARATPQSLDIIRAARPARAVLELNADTAQRLGIKAGDRVYCDALDPKPVKPGRANAAADVVNRRQP